MNWALGTTLVIAMAAVTVAPVAAADEEKLNQPLECMKDYKFKEFPIVAWCFHNYLGTDYTEEYARRVEGAGFNVALETGYMAKFYAKSKVKLLLSTMISDTLIEREKWGRKRTHPIEKGMSVADAHKKYGENPALIGFHIGSKYGRYFSRRLIQPIKDTEALKVGLFPWIAHCSDLEAHAKNGIAILSIETFKRDKWAAFGFENKGWQWEKRNAYCGYMEWGRRSANAKNMAFWPLYPGVTASKGDGEVIGAKHGYSEVRFMTLAPIAYGAQGLVCFGYSTARDVWQPDGPTYKAAAEVNALVTKVIGPRVLGHRSIGVFFTKAITRHPRVKIAPGSIAPAEGKLIEKMDRTALAGVLVREADFKSGANTPHYVMLVDARTATLTKEAEAVKPRELKVTFGPMVEAVEVIDAKGRAVKASGRTVSVKLRGGDGRLLKLTVKPAAKKETPKAVPAVEK